jgi:ligand-binding sensor domain-containing protein
LLVGVSNVWIGTDGDGLFEFNKTSRDVRRYGEKEGLMNDIIRSLCLAEDTLWIGYGVKNPRVERMQYGGLGEFALGTHQFRSFTPSLANGMEFEGSPTGPPPKGPPRQIVTSLACGRAGEVWFASSELCRLRLQDNSWDTFPLAGKCGTVAANANFLVAGAFWNYQGLPQHGQPGISILNFTNNRWSQLEDFGVLPSGVVTALAFDGDALWVGGMGFIAKINPQKNDLQKYAYVRAYNIEQIQIGGGYIWAQYDGQLHRGRLP